MAVAVWKSKFDYVSLSPSQTLEVVAILFVDVPIELRSLKLMRKIGRLRYHPYAFEDLRRDMTIPCHHIIQA